MRRGGQAVLLLVSNVCWSGGAWCAWTFAIDATTTAQRASGIWLSSAGAHRAEHIAARERQNPVRAWKQPRRAHRYCRPIRRYCRHASHACAACADARCNPRPDPRAAATTLSTVLMSATAADQSALGGQGGERTIACFCGECAVTVSGDPIGVSYCHCSRCRTLSGAPFVACALFEPGNAILSGETAEISTSAQVTRKRSQDALQNNETETCRQTDRPAQPQTRTAIGKISLMRAYIAADVQSVARPCSRAWANGWSFFRLRCLTRSTPTARLGGRSITCTMTIGSLTLPTTCPNLRVPPGMSAGYLHDHPRPILAWYW